MSQGGIVMFDKDIIQIGDLIHHRGLNKSGVFNETCVALEAMNPDPTSTFVQFDGEKEPREVSISLCDIKEFEPPNVCQLCLSRLSKNDSTICKSCEDRIKDRVGGQYGG